MVQDYEKAVINIQNFSKDYFEKNSLKSIVIGISGGIDSALCAALLEPVCQDLNMAVIGRSYPITTNKPDELERARLCGAAFCTNFKEIDLGPCFENMEDHIKNTEDPITDDVHALAIARGNVKARLRMIRLYELAGLTKGLVISTDNKTEESLGFWTINGDVGDFSPIQELWKTEVYRMSEYLITEWNKDPTIPNNIERIKALKSCVEAIPTDGLGITNSDLDQILPNWERHYNNTREAYEMVDQILILPEYAPKDHPVIKRHIATEFKRLIPIIIHRGVIRQ